MKIFIGADHAGLELKEILIPFLKSLGHDVEDKGAFEYNKDDDYPDFIIPVSEAVAQNNGTRGIIIGKSGQGEAMAANRIKGVRAMVWYGHDVEVLRLSREHNDANILSLGAGFVNKDKATDAVRYWLETPFSNDERHVRRIAKLDN